MNITKKTNILWPRAGWLPRHYLDFIPETLIQRGWNINIIDEWVNRDDYLQLPTCDVVFCHGPSVSRYFLSGKNKHTNTPPQIHHLWDLPTFRRWDAYWWHFTELEMEALKRRASKVFTLSQTVSNTLKTLFNIDSTPALQCFDNRIVEQTEASSREKPYVISASHHRDSKNLHTLIMGFAKFLEVSKEDVQLVITGDTGTNTRDYKKLGELYGLDIDWTGRIEKHEDVISLIKGAEMLLHPSLYEGFGLPPKEAIWAEVPAVVADTPVMRELHGDYITYINPVDPNSISHVLYNWVQKRKRSYDHRMAKKTIAKYAMLPQIERFEKQLLERTL